MSKYKGLGRYGITVFYTYQGKANSFIVTDYYLDYSFAYSKVLDDLIHIQLFNLLMDHLGLRISNEKKTRVTKFIKEEEFNILTNFHKINLTYDDLDKLRKMDIPEMLYYIFPNLVASEFWRKQ